MVTTGSTILGNWICLMSWPWAMTELTESLTVPVNHLKGIIAASRNTAKSAWSRANTICHHEHVDQQRDERVEDPPDVAQDGVGALLLDLRPDEVADEPPTRQHLVDGACVSSSREPGRARAALKVAGASEAICMGWPNGTMSARRGRPRQASPGALTRSGMPGWCVR